MLVERFSMLAAALLLGACASPPPPPAMAPVEPPPRWHTDGRVDGDAPAASAVAWNAFGSEELAALLVQAQQRNPDVAAAAARVDQADAALRVAGAALAPEVVARLDASATRPRDAAASPTGRSYGVALDAQYEVDLWGRQGAARDAALREAQAWRFDQGAIRLALGARVAGTWLQAVAAAERRDIARRNLGRATRALGLIQARVRAGATTPLELAQQQGLAATQARQVALLDQQAVDARVALTLLLGRTGVVELSTRGVDGLTAWSLDAGLPSRLLARRPDVAAAEARLAAADADVAAARAALLPRVTLGGSLGYGGDRLRTLLDQPLQRLVAGLAAPIFDRGRLAAQVEQSFATRIEVLVRYRQAIVAAFGEVEAALNAAAGGRAQVEAQADVLVQARRAANLAEARYRAGAETLLVWLDAQRTLYAAQDDMVQARLARLRADVDLHRALGGDWETSRRANDGLP